MKNWVDEIMEEYESMTDEEFDLVWDNIVAKRGNTNSLVTVDQYKEFVEIYNETLLSSFDVNYYKFGSCINDDMSNDCFELAA